MLVSYLWRVDLQDAEADHVVLDVPGRLGKILVGMNRALGESELAFRCCWKQADATVPLTVKFVSSVSARM